MSMVNASIQKTVISAGRIEILMADQKSIEHSNIWIQFSVPAPSESTATIGGAQLKALQIVLTAIAAQVAAIKAP